jgi:4-diphosphocytidyl-2-C-methyl-D-erythritol kinase
VSDAELAPAKVNLFLHVGPPAADGYHPLSSLMVFADVADQLTVGPADRFRLAVTGPFAAHAPLGGDNLVIRAVRALCRRRGAPEPELELVLEKNVPAGAGLGGGSADAAAALRLLARRPGLNCAGPELEEIAACLGSDIPACVRSRPLIAEGRGERLFEPPRLPQLPAVLARPPAAAATAAVYRAFDADLGQASAARPALPPAIGSVQDAARLLAGCRNDLEAPALRVEPRIGEVLQALRAAPETLLGRMSGSGSACFALCAEAAAAERLAGRLAAAHPDWWVRACTFRGC